MSKTVYKKMPGIEDAQHFLGVVMDNKDPKFLGRCRVNVFGLFDDLPVNDLPWAHQILSTSFGSGGGGGRFSVPKLGSIVQIRFNNGDYYAPEYTGLQEIAPDLIQEVSASYEGAHSLIYDGIENVRIYYTQSKGLILDVKDSIINIANDNSITIKHKGDQSIIELRGGKITETADSEIEATANTRIKHSTNEFWADSALTKLGHTPSYSAVLHEPLWIFLKMMASAIDAKFPSAPVLAPLADSYEQLSKSNNVKLSQN